MVLFTLVAGEGRLCKVEGVMSSYRKHAGGITTTTVQNGASYHWHRILLWLFMDRHFNYRYTAKCEELLLEHWRRILWQSTPKQRLNYLARSVRAVPGWFLRKPLFSIQRFLEAVKR
ncbi:MAG: hypothetical protein IPO60_07680 [Flavobacteriales bacterium]|nr:hypothetical protein [Flavobacteriales bacterium]